MRKSRIISTLLCVGFLVICTAGCGIQADAETDDEINAVSDADKDVMTAEDTGTDEQIESDNRLEADGSLETDDVVEGQDEMAEEEEMPLEGLYLSILGDSISTYDGYIPEGFSVMYPHEGKVTDVSQTWWMKLLEDTGMELCSNDSSSGTTCTGDSLFNENPGYGCTDYRTSLLIGKHGKMPDIIIVYLGTNDLLIGIELGDNDGTKVVEEGEVWNFSDAYTLILDKLESNYPAAQIYCCTLPPIGDWGTEAPFVTFTNRIGLMSEDYSERIRIISQNKGIPVLDLHQCGIDIDNMAAMTSDGVHLTPDGMECVERAILSGMGLTQDQ